MKSERIFKAIGNVDDELIKRYESSKKRKVNLQWIKWGGLAACLCLVLIGSLVLNDMFNVKEPSNIVSQGGDKAVGKVKPDGYSNGDISPSGMAVHSEQDRGRIIDQGSSESIKKEKSDGYLVKNIPSPSKETYVASGTIINTFQSAPASMYATPENGKSFCFTEVKNALKTYAGQDVTYFLAMDIFADQAKLEDASDAVKAELKRLTELGYHVGYSECWTYQGKGEQVTIPYIAGYFTEKELENFAASKNYGYCFRFALNGDGSPVSADQGIITGFGK